MNFQGMRRVSLVPSLHDSTANSTHVRHILEVFHDRAVTAAVNSAHTVPDPSTTKTVRSRISLVVKVLLFLRALKKWCCEFADISFCGLNHQTPFLVIYFNKMTLMFPLYFQLTNLII